MRANWRKFAFVFLVLIAICLFLHYFVFNERNQNSVQQSIHCQIAKTAKTIRGNSMESLLKAGEEIILLEGYYQCYSVQRGDIVAYDYAGNENPLIKRVAVLGGERIEFRNAHLLVNDEILKNSQGDAYVFSEKQKKMFGLYLKNGELVNNAYLIFGENIHNGLDSRRFGAVSADNFLGKFED